MNTAWYYNQVKLYVYNCNLSNYMTFNFEFHNTSKATQYRVPIFRKFKSIMKVIMKMYEPETLTNTYTKL